MARKKSASQSRPEATAEALRQSVVDSAQKIWLAGLGAFSRARSEGDSVFNTLVEQGKGLRERARGAADEALKTVRGQADATMTQAQGQWDKLEHVFEERVARSLNRLGVMTRQEVDDLSRQVEELNKTVLALMKSQGGGKASRPGTRKPAAKKRARKAKS
jgi:poly(hydroxyalkanoate) granule-associated protein